MLLIFPLLQSSRVQDKAQAYAFLDASQKMWNEQKS